MKLSSMETDRRGFLAVSAAGFAASVTGCLNEERADDGFRSWMPDTAEPMLSYFEMEAVDTEGDEAVVYGLHESDVEFVIESDFANVLSTDIETSLDWTAEEVGEHRGYTVYQGEFVEGEYAAWDGRRLVEADSRADVEDVVDAYLGERPRLHEEDNDFARVSEEVAAAEIVDIREHGSGVAAYGVETGDGEGMLTVAATGDDEDLRDIEEELERRDYVDVMAEDVELEDGWMYATGEVSEGDYLKAVGVYDEASGSEEAAESPPPSVSLDVSFDVETDEATVVHEGGDHVDVLRVYVDGELADVVEDAQAGDSVTVSVAEGDEIRATVVDDERESGTMLGVYRPEEE